MIPLTQLLLAQAWAASAGADGHSASITQLIYPLINFLIFAYLIKRFALPALKGHLRSRRERILTDVTGASEAKGRIEATLRDYRDRLSRLEEAKKNILDTLRAESERERTRLLRESEESAAKIKADADFVAQQEVKVARYELRKEMVLMAQAAAEKIIKADFRDADQQHLLDQFLLGIKESG